MSLLGYYTVRGSLNFASHRRSSSVLHSINDGYELNYQKLGELTVVVSEHEIAHYWKRHKKKRIRKKWLKRWHGIESYASLHKGVSGTWFIHPELFKLIRNTKVTDKGLRNLESALDAWHSEGGLTRLRPLEEMERQ